jgi:hypothetical protein
LLLEQTNKRKCDKSQTVSLKKLKKCFALTGTTVNRPHHRTGKKQKKKEKSR